MSALFNIPLLLLAAGSSIRVIDDANDEKPNYYKVSFDVAPSGSRVIKEEMEALHQGERDVAMGVALQPSPTPVLKEEMEALHASLLSLGLTETASRLVQEAQAVELDRLHQSLLSLGLVKTAQTLLKESQVPVQEGSQPHAGALLNTTHERVKGEKFRTLVYVEENFKTGTSSWAMGDKELPATATMPAYSPIGKVGWEFALLYNQWESRLDGQILLVGAPCAREDSPSGNGWQRLQGPWKVLEDGWAQWFDNKVLDPKGTLGPSGPGSGSMTDEVMDIKYPTIHEDEIREDSAGTGIHLLIEGSALPPDEKEYIPQTIRYPVFAGTPGSQYLQEGRPTASSWDNFYLLDTQKTPGKWEFEKETRVGRYLSDNDVNAIMNEVWIGYPGAR